MAQRRRTATIYSVAERAGVSIATVSRTLRDPASVSPGRRERVLAAIEALDYLPSESARALAAGAHEAHGLILPELDGVYYADLLAGYESAAGELGQSVVLVLASGRADLARRARTLANRVDGLTVMGSAGLPTTSIATLAQQLPVVVIAGAPQTGAEVVRAESLDAATELTLRLIDAGREHIVFAGDPDAAVDVHERYAGYVAAHRARDRRPSAPMRVTFDEQGGRAVADRVARRTHRPDALVCANDLLALAAHERLREHGIRVPDDVALTGWDDELPARYVRPRLTTVRQPVRALAALAARRLHERIAGDQSWGRTHVLPSEVIIRESCGTGRSIPEDRSTQEEGSSP